MEAENQGDEINCKITLIGETNVGKTSLIQQYVNNIFDPNYITTIGGDQVIKPIISKNKKLNLNIFNFLKNNNFQK
jgi:Ras-related protein Rab-7A